MKPTELLKSEHRVIEQVLDCLVKIAEETKTKKTLDAESANQAIDFFKNFADKCHHGKEEVHLFPMMEAKGFPRESGPTGVMLHEHELGRKYIKGMSDAVPAAGQGDENAIDQFVQNAQGYYAMLKEHINKEDHCLFSMADEAFSDDDQKQLSTQFDKVEHEEMGAGTHEKYLGIANHLADKYHVQKAEIPDEAKNYGCSHH